MMAGLRTMRFVVGLAMSCFLGMQTLLWHRAGIHVMEDSDAAHLHRPIPTTTANRPKIQALHVPATLPALPSEQGRQQQQQQQKQQQQQQQQAYPNRNPTPTQCTSEQLDMIEYQLPPKRCKKFANKPWQNRCSFSYATRCPKAVWLEEFYRHEHIHNHNHKPIAIYVGCNKAMDAVNTLRMISSDTAFDKDVWRDRLFANQTVSSGNCNQEFEPQFALKDTAADLKFPLEAVVHCIEASPITARRLKQTIEELGWQSSLVVVNAAMAASDGYARFPDRHVNSVGVETISMVDCTITGRKRFCKKIQQYKLDTYAQQFVLPATQPIDFLSIDVEGFDWEVLLGATRTLERVNYLEFEYNWKGAWGNQTLSSAIGQLKEQGFVCYWAGSFGNLWRITDCWMDYYDLRFWSNVACVNTRQAAVQSMAARMEELFLETLASGRDIRYHNASSANTNGKLEWGLS